LQASCRTASIDENIKRGYAKVVEQIYVSNEQISYPLKDWKGIGYMLQKLNMAIEK
jgi:hypothetical protein